MKKLIKGALFLALVGITMLSCKKDNEDSFSTFDGEIMENSNNLGFLWSSYPCLVRLPEGEEGPLNKGSNCVVSAIDGCSSATDCNAISQANLSNFFTEDELQAWESGDLEFENNAEFISEHYAFYLYLYDNDLGGHHPDTIIERNGF
jgi:hypothetical protein